MKIVGVDLGGTQLRIRLCDEFKEVLVERKELVSGRSPGDVVKQLSDLVLGMQQEVNVETLDLSVSCAVAGMLDSDGQVVKNAPNLGWRDVPFASLIQDALPQAQRVALWNDLDAATWGEFVAGAGRGVDNVAAVFVGSGVGGGLVLGGRLHRGSWGVAGEIGHLKVRPNGRRCGCGGEGCVEAYAGGHSMARMAREWVEEGKSDFLQGYVKAKGIESLELAIVAEGARQGDSGCLAMMEQAGDALGLVMSHLVTLVNPAKIILGGGVFMNWKELRELAEERAHFYTSTPAHEGLQFVTSSLGNDAGLVGAIDLARSPSLES